MPCIILSFTSPSCNFTSGHRSGRNPPQGLDATGYGREAVSAVGGGLQIRHPRVGTPTGGVGASVSSYVSVYNSLVYYPIVQVFIFAIRCGYLEEWVMVSCAFLRIAASLQLLSMWRHLIHVFFRHYRNEIGRVPINDGHNNRPTHRLH